MHADDPDDVTLGAANTAPTATEIRNTSDSLTAIRGVGTTGPGVTGRSRDHHGTQGFSDDFTGVWGQSTFDYGVIGFAPTGARAGSLGYSAGNKTGVYGLSKGNGEVPARPPTRPACTDAPSEARPRSVSAVSRAPVGAGPSSGTSPAAAQAIGLAFAPPAGLAGDLFLDSSRRLWLCKGGSTWARLDTLRVLHGRSDPE